MAVSFSNQLFLALISLVVILNSTFSGSSPVVETENIKFIRRSCGITTYPTLCVSSLAAHANAIQTSPMRLSHTALSLSYDATRSTSVTIALLAQSHGLLPREAAAMRDCVEELGDSIDQLKRSLAEMNELNGPNYGLVMNNIQTWVSAALTDEDTCTEGFKGAPTGSKVRSQVRERILNVSHMTSNALALINTYAAVHG
ncbi:pectinesterase inhibitor 11-like [Impatiens glandulifera]|uniref:pectinesterase inhibitor 11-like n=1 Tax=Impatiens glandulifera TaxID=253017 RepID=UPI001FB0F1F1|nr:pectinesterase inhibitor 11-like [Impatiens glandulifera]